MEELVPLRRPDAECEPVGHHIFDVVAELVCAADPWLVDPCAGPFPFVFENGLTLAEARTLLACFDYLPDESDKAR